jgi:hypothetical protein
VGATIPLTMNIITNGVIPNFCHDLFSSEGFDFGDGATSSGWDDCDFLSMGFAASEKLCSETLAVGGDGAVPDIFAVKCSHSNDQVMTRRDTRSGI